MPTPETHLEILRATTDVGQLDRRYQCALQVATEARDAALTDLTCRVGGVEVVLALEDERATYLNDLGGILDPSRGSQALRSIIDAVPEVVMGLNISDVARQVLMDMNSTRLLQTVELYTGFRSSDFGGFAITQTEGRVLHASFDSELVRKLSTGDDFLEDIGLAHLGSSATATVGIQQLLDGKLFQTLEQRWRASDIDVDTALGYIGLYGSTEPAREAMKNGFVNLS